MTNLLNRPEDGDKLADLLCVVLLAHTPWRFMRSADDTKETQSGQLMRRIMQRAHRAGLRIHEETQMFADAAFRLLQELLERELKRKTKRSEYWTVFEELHKHR